ncbi:DUF3847 domain-containing protein [Bacillus sp. ISL-18]|uniref:DUF3847 domain-containing protein n=1 Tax=Bacillus sp. ISL-18 TaxID=2819118 RepID=UPI001BE5156E|nr:DUF3847 domain-containing protein [Bacillus sp. ISL-18]MBT2655395.1 DUF3847 domain-containing protein [Bacillus sp. ISL-18]
MSNDELQKLENKIKALEQKKKVLEYKISNEDRRERTRRLIQKGALFEQYMENEKDSLTDTEDLLKVLADFKNRNNDYILKQIQKMKEIEKRIN